MYTVYSIHYTVWGVQPHFSMGKNGVGPPPQYTLYSIHDVVGYTMYNEHNAMYFV